MSATIDSRNKATAVQITRVAGSTRILSIEAAALPPEYADRTTVAADVRSSFIERALESVGLRAIARRLRELRHAWSFFCESQDYDAIVTLGDLTGLAVAFFNRLFGRRKTHVMYDCLWYGGNALKRAWMRYCIGAVDRCVVWASIERQRYARAYGVPEDKFIFVPHHHTTKNYTFEVKDAGYIFTGGNWSRDYALFLDAVRDIDFPCVLATNRLELLDGLVVPKHVHVVSATPAEFRKLLAECHFVVLPMQADQLHAGGQQTFLNAMMMGKPVILTDPEGGRDYIKHGETGLLVPYPNVTALRDAIRLLTVDTKVVSSMGARARSHTTSLTTVSCNAAIWKYAFGNRRP